MVQEHKDLIAAIREDKPYCEGWTGASSSMTAVLGRLATYSGKIVKWDEAVAKGTSEFPAKLAWDAPAPVEQGRQRRLPDPHARQVQAVLSEVGCEEFFGRQEARLFRKSRASLV